MYGAEPGGHFLRANHAIRKLLVNLRRQYGHDCKLLLPQLALHVRLERSAGIQRQRPNADHEDDTSVVRVKLVLIEWRLNRSKLMGNSIYIHYHFCSCVRIFHEA
jgi:hypothetical protein